MRAAAAAAAASGQPMAVKRDGLLVMLALNTILLVAVLITSWVDVGALKLFTYEWVHRLQSVDARTHTQLAANMTKEAYLQNRDSSPAKLGSMLEDVFQWARCAPAAFGGDLQWDASEISPTCNCLRNVHVEYAKAVHPDNTRLSESEFDLPVNKYNVSIIADASMDKCFMSIRNTQVDDSWGGFASTNTAAVALFWNVMGCMVSIFLFFFDGILRMRKGASSSSYSSASGGADSESRLPITGSNAYVTIMARDHFGDSLKIIILFVPVLAILVSLAVLAASYGDAGIHAIWYILAGFLFAAMASYWCWKEHRAIPKGETYSTMRATTIWAAFCFVAPYVANAMNVLLQRRDAMVNIASFLGVFAAGMCAIAIDLMQQFFEDTLIAGCDSDEKAMMDLATMSKRKNTLVKVILTAAGAVMLLLAGASLPVFQACSFSNMSCTVLVVSALLFLCFASCLRHVVHPQWVFSEGRWRGVFNSSTTWDLYPLDPVTLETVARFIFTLAALADIWMVNRGQWDTRLQARDPRFMMEHMPQGW